LWIAFPRKDQAPYDDIRTADNSRPAQIRDIEVTVSLDRMSQGRA
jgi:hypothetical protein